MTPSEQAANQTADAVRKSNMATCAMTNADRFNLKGRIPDSWLCVDCGWNTAPGVFDRFQIERVLEAVGGKWPAQGFKMQYNHECEVFRVRDAVWEKAGMEPFGGCLCVGCLEKRVGHKLTPKDFEPNHTFNATDMPSTPRLLSRLWGTVADNEDLSGP
jgi:hypothetical protein